MTSTIALIERWRLDIQRYPYGDSTCTVQRSDDGEWCRYDEAVTELTTLLQRCEKAEQERDNLGSSLRECSRYRGLAEEQAEIAEVKLREEIKIVDRVWAALGISTYEQAGGKEISEIVADWKARAEKAEADAKYRLDMWDATQTALNKAEADHLMVTELYNACSSDYTIAVTRAELAEAQRDEALKALEPFAQRADEWKHNSNAARVSVKLSDLRAASNAMGEPKT